MDGVGLRVARLEVDDVDFDDAVGVDDVALFDERSAVATAHGYVFEITLHAGPAQ